MTTAVAERTTVRYNPWAEELYQPSGLYDFNMVGGGRGSSKTYEITQAIAYRGHQEPLRIAICREHLNSIKESAKPELDERIRALGLERPDCYTIHDTSIDHANGTHIFWQGLSKSSEEDIKGLKANIVWVEEAHAASGRSWELLRPTVRADESLIIASFNPTLRTDAVYKWTEENKYDPYVWYRHVTYRDNMFFTARNDRERLREQENEPERYQHIWEGKTDDGDADTLVLAYGVLDKCVKAWKEGLAPPVIDAPVCDGGLDLAYGGPDKCALIIRRGPVVESLDMWPGIAGYLTPAASRAHTGLAEADAYSLYYDATGGDTIMGEFMRLDPNYRVLPVNFGGKVAGPGVMYEPRRTNEQVFARRNAQMAFNLRLRANRTVRLMNGDTDVDPATCLFIRSDIPRLEQYLSELTQPKYRSNPTTGKIEIDKRGDENKKSPDSYDATALAFARDCDYLRARL